MSSFQHRVKDIPLHSSFLQSHKLQLIEKPVFLLSWVIVHEESIVLKVTHPFASAAAMPPRGTQTPSRQWLPAHTYRAAGAALWLIPASPALHCGHVWFCGLPSWRKCILLTGCLLLEQRNLYGGTCTCCWNSQDYWVSWNQYSTG